MSFVFKRMGLELTHQHNSSLILLGLLYSVLLSLSLKCFVYLNSQSTSLRRRNHIDEALKQDNPSKALWEIKQQLSMHPLSVFYTKGNTAFTELSQKTSGWFLIKYSLYWGSSPALWLSQSSKLRKRVPLCSSISQTSRFDFYLEHHKFSFEH